MFPLQRVLPCQNPPAVNPSKFLVLGGQSWRIARVKNTQIRHTRVKRREADASQRIHVLGSEWKGSKIGYTLRIDSRPKQGPYPRQHFQTQLVSLLSAFSSCAVIGMRFRLFTNRKWFHTSK